MEEIIDEKEAARAKQLLSGKLGFDISTYDDKFLMRRMRKRMQYLGETIPDNYCQRVMTNDAEKEELLHELAINVTNFMRDKIPFRIFQEDIIPLMIKEKKTGEDITVWSAGCASGEEPYSIAILFFESLGRKMHDYKLRIIGSDMSETAIKRAASGIYDESQFKEMDPAYVEKYFKSIGDKKYEVKQHVKDLVEFRKLNLLSDKPPARFDAVFCRNTVIYFSKEGKEKLFMDIYDSLKPGGFFIMGKTETLMGPAREKFKPISLAERVYEKQKTADYQI